MKEVTVVPKATMQRYPLYLKALRKLAGQNVKRILSKDLGQLVNIEPTTIRRDFSFIGCLGKQGYGYDVDYLIKVFTDKLGGGFNEQIVLIGVGNLGRALLNYNRWDYVIGEITMAFDIDPQIIGKTISGVPVYDIAQLEEKIPHGCRIAILTASKDVQPLVERLHRCGVIGLVDFTHQHIQIPKDMIWKSVDVVTTIQELIFEANAARGTHLSADGQADREDK
jgi:redox-sensing transcriptional repressor